MAEDTAGGVPEESARWRAVAEVVRKSRAASGVPGEVPYASQGQEQLHALIEQYPAANAAYNIDRVYKLSGPLDEGALQRAVSAVVARHESLRTAFRRTGGSLRRTVLDEAPPVLRTTDLAHLPAKEREEAARRAVARAAEEPFDLAEAPLLRAVLIRTGEERYAFALVVHHLVADGWSVSLVQREIADAYACSGRPVPAVPGTYAEFVARQRAALATEAGRASLRRWVRHLHDLPPAAGVPADGAIPAAPTFRGDKHTFRIDADLSRTLRRAAADRRTTVAVVVLAAFCLLLHEDYGHEDIVCVAPFANRWHRESRRTVGYFAHTHALRIRAEHGVAPATLLARADRELAGAFAHQDVPPSVIEAELARTTHGEQLVRAFQTMFVFHEGHDEIDLRLPGISVTQGLYDTNATAKSALALLVQDASPGIVCQLEYSTDLYREATISGVAQAYVRALRRIAAL